MSDRTPLQLYVYAVDDNDRPAVLEAIAEFSLALEWGQGETPPRHLELGRCYGVHEATLGSSDDLANLLRSSAPSAVFTLWQDPYMTADGHLVAHVPGVGSYETGCDAEGTPHVDAVGLAARLGRLAEDATVRDWLSGDGDGLLGVTVLAALHQHEKSCAA
ncbi:MULTISPECIES: hypothetical protein [unclassified Streptomyces]|uniref:hypothetical protein n=1 Tax=unclassified Streptomyces TaxID=2593676 RepID=UPI00081F6726|nr:MULTISPECIES: hypothetical protein [unclassified Streptomyces]MYZ33743.1 hypothetical protein [Streptomyces sp. SID4917]SCF61454.1 hypothetical protein GA0115259_1001714 [Streptomyces sp. MnatMP-M17]